MTAPGRGPVVFLQQASRPFHLSVGLVVGLGAGVLLILHLLNQSPAFAAWAAGSRAEVASGPAWLQRLKTAQVVITKLGLIATAKTRRGDSLDTVQQAQQRTLDSLETKPGVAGPALTACEAVVATCSAKADQYQQAAVAGSLRADSLQRLLGDAVTRGQRADSLLKVGLQVQRRRCGWQVTAGAGAAVNRGLVLAVIAGWGCQP